MLISIKEKGIGNMIKQLLKRKIAYLMQSSESSIINTPNTLKSYQRFNKSKEEEIIVWIRQLVGMDKNQIMDFIINKFNISEDDAERLFFKAYPDGLSSIEEDCIESFTDMLPKNNPEELSNIIDNSINIALQGDVYLSNNIYNDKKIDNETLEIFVQFLSNMLQARKLT